jgi:hypothetical protein
MVADPAHKPAGAPGHRSDLQPRLWHFMGAIPLTFQIENTLSPDKIETERQSRRSG